MNIFSLSIVYFHNRFDGTAVLQYANMQCHPTQERHRTRHMCWDDMRLCVDLVFLNVQEQVNQSPRCSNVSHIIVRQS